MSIIYDALKKVEESGIREDKAETGAVRPRRHNYKAYLFYGVAACAGLFIMNFFFSLLSRPKEREKLSVAQQPPQPAPYSAQPQQEILAPAQQLQPDASQIQDQPVESGSFVEMTSKGPLILNGIFFSEGQGYALINNHIVKQGDTVDGAAVKSIAADEVELEIDGKSLKLATEN